MTEKLKQAFVIIATCAVMFVNYLASTGYINGVTPDFVSNKYPTIVTPAGYAFSIWGIIYLGLTVFSIFQAMPVQLETLRKIRTPYLVSCLANCVWIYVWHHELLLVSVCAMLVLLASLIAININLSKADSAIVRIPFGIYFAWVTVASTLNITIWLNASGFKEITSNSILFACILIICVTIIGIILRFKLPNAAYPVTVAWAILAIAIKNGSVAAISGVSAFCFMGLLIAALLPFIRLNEAKN